MRIALLQLNPRLADPEFNARAIESAYAKAIGQGAELVITPEIALVGYLAEDRLWEPALRSRVETQAQRLAALSGGVPLLLGTVGAAPSGRLWNEVWWCEGGARRAVVRKRVLPTYDVFDEHRYFEPDSSPQALIEYEGERIGLSICEDLWADASLVSGPVSYAIDPIAELKAAGATMIVNVSASPGTLGSYVPEGLTVPWAIPSKASQRKRLLKGHALKHAVPIVYCSRVGAESWLLFDGGSGVAMPDGSWHDGPEFIETTVWANTKQSGGPWPEDLSEGRWLREALGMGLRDNLRKQGLEGVVIGMSGGMIAPSWPPWPLKSLVPTVCLASPCPRASAVRRV
jgi:NAD+ synthase (glutamine-hydrolysing)